MVQASFQGVYEEKIGSFNLNFSFCFLRSFHVVNAPMLFSVGYNILKPFLAEEYKVKDHVRVAIHCGK